MFESFRNILNSIKNFAIISYFLILMILIAILTPDEPGPWDWGDG